MIEAIDQHRGCSHGADRILRSSDRYASLDAKKDPLVGIDAVVPWEELKTANQ
ncbi:MAG: hypothetical protein ACI91Z_001707 [Yoonia sp.]|jgi:hypothetical protein